MKIEGLDFAYDDFKVFENFSFSSESSLILFMGPSGCGKTTLFKIIAGILKEGMKYEIFETSDRPYLVLQEDALCPWLSGIDNITKFIDISTSDLEKSSIYQHTKSFISKKACHMSFGQRRLVEMLRSICYKPNLLLLDEPFNYLDFKSRAIVSETLFDLISSGSTKIMFSSHYNEDIGKLNPEIHKFDFGMPIKSLNHEEG